MRVAGQREAHLYMNVFGLAVDTSLQCFIAAEEMGCAEERLPPRDSRGSNGAELGIVIGTA